MMLEWFYNKRKQAEERKMVEQQIINELLNQSDLLGTAQRSEEGFGYGGSCHIEVRHSLYRRPDGRLFFAVSAVNGGQSGFPRIKDCEEWRAREWLKVTGHDTAILSQSI